MTLDTSADIRRAWHDARLAPLWESSTAHRTPQAPDAPHLWQWQAIRPLIELAFRETSPEAVERRVLQLISPHAASMADEFTVGTILAAIQCLLPGETARPHRHTMNALRFVLEGSGATTLVDGKPCLMEQGDLILTPAWCWHEHRHGGGEKLLWLDVLDVPLHAMLGTVRFQPPPVMDMPETMDDRAFAVANFLPEAIHGRPEHSPVFRYPYRDAVRALEYAPASADGIRRVRYVNPLTGGPAMQILDCSLMQIDPGVTGGATRTNANTVCAVIEGHGETRIGDHTIQWGPNDFFTLPQWNWVSHHAGDAPARLFTVTDREVMRALGLLHVETAQAGQGPAPQT